MKKAIALILILAVLVSSLSAATVSYEYEPYVESEFPIWSQELRRAETIFFGSYVITLPVASGVIPLVENYGNLTFDTSNQEAMAILAVASGVSLFIATLDWVLGKF